MTVKTLTSLVKPSPEKARFVELSSCHRGESGIADPASPRFADIFSSAKKSVSEKPSWQTSALFRAPAKNR